MGIYIYKMEEQNQTTEQRKAAAAAKKKEYMREYMRNWKAKQYAANPEIARRNNRTKYLKKTKQIDDDDIKKYGEFLHTVVLLRKLISEVRLHRPEILVELLWTYYV